jgi:hypothetical protein
MLSVLLLVASCGGRGPDPLPAGDEWLAAVQPGTIVNYRETSLIASDGSPERNVPRCVADSSTEEPVLSRGGRSLLLFGCWNAKGEGDGNYAVRAYLDGRTVVLDSEASTGAWIDDRRAVLADGTGVVRIADFSSSPPGVSVALTIEHPVISVDVSTDGDSVVLHSAANGGSADPEATQAVIASLESGASREMDLPQGASALFWKGEEQVVVEAAGQWLTMDAQSAEVVERVPLPSSPKSAELGLKDGRCRLIGANSLLALGFCPATGEIVKVSGTSVSTVARAPGENLDYAMVSIASGLV